MVILVSNLFLQASFIIDEDPAKDEPLLVVFLVKSVLACEGRIGEECLHVSRVRGHFLGFGVC